MISFFQAVAELVLYLNGFLFCLQTRRCNYQKAAKMKKVSSLYFLKPKEKSMKNLK
jgi:hypothetical protein